ncbi:hypothetical protein MSIMFB_05691 [Mycobacterium simulans]|uniref:Uncharacterized protein n=1 Tax=Mycobacterium simulans TaxID=627089 RepID=A0A7Z7IQY7_9MYCO|nr:hypothetical protein MSIMFB_05691 [Mycobacterium simulans]
MVVAVRVARTGTVFMKRPTIDSTPANSAGRPATVIPNTTSCWPVNQFSRHAQPACRTVLTVVLWARAIRVSASVVASDKKNDLMSLLVRSNGSGGPTRVGAVKPDRSLPHTVRARSWSRAASQHTKLR